MRECNLNPIADHEHEHVTNIGKKSLSFEIMRHKMTRCFKLTGIAFFLLLAGAPTLLAQPQWQYTVNQYGYRQAFIEQESIVLGSNCSTYLEFNAATRIRKDSIPYLSLKFTVSPYSSIKGFDFEYFHGVGAPVGEQKLMRVTITKGGKPSVHKLITGGWLSAEVDNGFVFNASNPTYDKQSQVRKILDQVLQSAESLEVAIINGKDHLIVLSATFPLTGSKPVIEAFLKGL
jgi:hypothetical protein